MNRLSRWMPGGQLKSGHPLARPLFVARTLILSTVLLPSCDPPPSKQPSTNDQLDASTAPARKQCSNGGVWTKRGCVPPSSIKLNTVGYLVGRGKFASVPADVTDSTFVVRDVATQEQIYSGSLSANVTDVTDTGDSVRLADFTSVNEPGAYVLEVSGLSASPPFEIGDTVYNDILKMTLVGLYGQRCGVSVTFDYDGDTFSHAACHRNDAQFDSTMVTGMTGTQEATGGWHDAGDYGKYTVNGAFSVAFLLKAWEDFGQPLATVNHIPHYTDSLPTILAEAKFQLDWLLKMQTTDGSVLHLVCPKVFPGDTISPEADRPPRYFLQPSTGATAYFTAAVAMASRVFRPFDDAYADNLLSAAQKGMAWLAANPSDIRAADGTQQAPFVAGGPYNVSSGPGSPSRTWASIELWRANGDGDLTSVESTLRTMSVSGNWDWAGPGNFAMFDYAASDSTLRDAATLTAVQSAITSVADTLTSTAQTHGYGRALGAGSYYWGSNGLVARTVMNLQAAYHITSDAKYLDTATQQVDYLLGRNPFGRSLVTGLGYAPPVFPHHRPSNSDAVDEPWPGLLVGGANKDADDPQSQANPNVPAGKAWYDLASDYYVNEIAINWNGALIYAVAGFVK